MNEKHQQRFAICVNNDGYPASLELHKVYRIASSDDDRSGDIRVIDESGEDYIYPSDYFLEVKLPTESAALLERSYSAG